MESRVEAVQTAVADLERPRTFYEVGVFEGTIYTAGEGSFLASLIETAGGEPITGDALSTSIAARGPRRRRSGAHPARATRATTRPSRAESVAARPGWETMTAVADGRVVPVAEDIVITRPGPRIVDGLEALARAIHPDAFDELTDARRRRPPTARTRPRAHPRGGRPRRRRRAPPR